MDSSIEWFSRNLTIAGLSADDAAFTVAKELVHNAVDACRDKATKIMIDVSELIEDGNSIIRVSCTDWGKGLGVDEVDAVAGIFKSTKSESFSAGKFGVGLKLIALHSQRATGRPITLKTPTFIVDLGLIDDTIDIVSFQKVTNEYNDNLPSLEAVAHTICNDLQRFTRNFLVYMSELSKSLGGTADLTLTVNGSLVFPYEHPKPKPLIIYYSTKNMSASFEMCLDHKDKRNESDRQFEKISLIRSVNQVPLLFRGSDCEMIAAFNTALSQCAVSLGLRDIGPITAGSLQADKMSDFDPVSCCSSLTGCPGSNWSHLIVRIDASLSSTDCEYTSLIKSGISSKDGHLTGSVARVLSKLFSTVKRKWPAEFQSNNDAGKHAAMKVYIPAISNCVANVITRSTNARFREGTENILGVQNDAGPEFKKAVCLAIRDSLESRFLSAKRLSMRD